MLPGVAPIVDNLFLLAVAALGWGLSLATYQLFARSKGWPMGALQANAPYIPVLIGLVGLFSALAFATARGAEDGGWVIIVLGIAFAAIWTWLLRVASQLSLILAPIATFLLLLGWLAVPLGLTERRWATERPSETLQRRGVLNPEPSPASSGTTTNFSSP
jgi:hypothetical protein